MTDQELLTYTAKAVGIKFDEDSRTFEGDCRFDWNPLTRDADAFRLMVKLSIRVRPYCGDGDDYTTVTIDNHGRITEEHNGDALAATRRAIVRAAAEIGKGM